MHSAAVESALAESSLTFLSLRALAGWREREATTGIARCRDIEAFNGALEATVESVDLTFRADWEAFADMTYFVASRENVMHCGPMKRS